MDEHFALPPDGNNDPTAPDPVAVGAEAARHLLRPELNVIFSDKEGSYEPGDPRRSEQRYSEPHEVQVRDDEIASLKREMRTDALTGLPNKVAFDEELGKRVSDRQKLAVGVLDLTNFKAINDRYGHKVGDDVIREVGKVMHAVIKSTRKTDFLAHLSGDEFAIILDMTPHRDDALSPEDRVTAIREHLMHDVSGYATAAALDQFGVDIAIGVALHRSGSTPQETFDAADADMFRHKDQQHSEHGSYR